MIAMQMNSTESHNSTMEEIPSIQNATSEIYNQAVAYICNKFRIEVSTGEEAIEMGAGTPQEQIFSMFQVVYMYFFCFAGLCLIVLSILFLIGKRRKLRGELIGAALRAFAGVALVTLAAISHTGTQINGVADTDEHDAIHNYMYSSMVLPTVLIVYLFGKSALILTVSGGIVPLRNKY